MFVSELIHFVIHVTQFLELAFLKNAINIKLFCAAKAPQKPIQAVYVPSHLFHMLFELFKVCF